MGTYNVQGGRVTVPDPKIDGRPLTDYVVDANGHVVLKTAPTTPPTQPPTGNYDSVFNGDNTGNTDVTAAMISWLSQQSNKTVQIPSGKFKVSKQATSAMVLVSDMHDLTIDCAGTLIVDGSKGKDGHGVLRFRSYDKITVNDLKVTGSNNPFIWSDPAQYEHAIWFEGDAGVATVNRLVARYMGGDACYNSAEKGTVTVVDCDSAYVGRNGLSPVAGKMIVTRGKFIHNGLHGIDAEPNDASGAQSIDLTVDGARIETYGDLRVETGVAAVAGGGFRASGTTGVKIAVRVRNVTADVLQIYVRDTALLEVTGSKSDANSRVAPGYNETLRSVIYWENVANRTISSNSANMTTVNGHP